MHIHGAQLNRGFQLDAAYAAQQAQAKREAAAVRKKLMESASKLASGSGANWNIRARQDNSEGRSKRKNEQEGNEKPGAEQEQAASFPRFGELLASLLIR